MTIKINGLTPINGEGNLKAFVHLSVGDFSIQAVRIIQEKDKKAWVALPQQLGKNGSWYPVVKCENAALRNEITTAVLAEWQATLEDESDEISRV